VNKPTLSKVACVLFVFCAATAIASPAQLLTTLHSFTGSPSDPANPYVPAGLVQATDGNFYGTTYFGGAHYGGTVFKITPSGTLTTLYSFCSQANCTDGENPGAGLVQGTDGNFYGTTVQGGVTNGDNCDGCGTVFKITPSGTLTTLHAFAGNPTEGQWPLAPLVQGTDGNFYGTTEAGGGSLNCGAGASGCGTVFRITPGGTLTTLHSFQATDGLLPVAGLVQATDGNFYGTTQYGGTVTNCSEITGTCGTVFKVTPQGALTTLYSFDSSDGAYPQAGLLQASDGNFYGTTREGGASQNCSYQTYGCGTVFRITPEGTLTTLHSFTGTDGSYPYAGLVQATDGNFYGTTYNGDLAYCHDGCGTVFKITSGGTLTTLHSFAGIARYGIDGANPSAGLVQATDGNFYGTTYGGGAHNDGTVFRLVTARACIVCPSVE